MVLPVAVIDKVPLLGGATVAFVALVIVKPLPPLNTKGGGVPGGVRLMLPPDVGGGEGILTKDDEEVGEAEEAAWAAAAAA